MRKLAIALVAAALCLCLAGCSGGAEGSGGEGAGSGAASSQAAGVPDDAIKVDDLAWTVENSSIEGQRVVGFTFVNNTPYTIVGVDMEFVQRADVTDEQRAVFDEIYEDNSMWEDMNGGPEEVYVTTSGKSVVEAGATSPVMPCTFNHTMTLVDNMDQYDLMEPSMLSVAFISDGKLYLEYYDYATGSYSSSSQSGKDAVSWSDTTIAAQVPKIEATVVSVTSDSDDYFSVTALGVSRDAFDTYLDQCKEQGFTVDPYNGKDYYTASDDEGYELSLSYSGREGYMSLTINGYDVSEDAAA